MKKILALLVIGIVGLTGCRKFDDSALWNSIGELDKRVERLEELCAKMNTNISSLQAIVHALESHDYIENVVSLPNGDGYIISFASGKDITIYHGEDGKDGTDGDTPIISIKQDTDGVYYWTVNGEWLLVEGKKVKATGENGNNGSDGADGVTPKFKIENGYWYISYDNGISWEQLGKATGEDGSNGQDGVSPEFKIDNGYWYVSYDKGKTWTQIGQATGNNGQDGADGADGITPQFKIEDGYWYVSYDNKMTWEQVGQATGENGQDGACIFKNVSFHNGYMYLTLNDSEETIIKLPFAIGNKEVICVNIESGKSLISYFTSDQLKTITSLKVTGVLSLSPNMRDINVKMQALEYLDLSEAECITNRSYFELNPLRLYLPNRVLNTFISPQKITYHDVSGDSPLTPQIININDCVNLKKLIITSNEPEMPSIVVGEKTQSGLWGNRLDSLIFRDGVSTIMYDLDIAKTVILPESTKAVRLETGGGYSFTPLDELICKAQVPPQVLPTNISGGIVKRKYETATLYVPAESIDLYKAADGWKNFKNIKQM